MKSLQKYKTFNSQYEKYATFKYKNLAVFKGAPRIEKTEVFKRG